MALNPRYRLFVEAYDGDETYAARIAGYTGSDRYLKEKGLALLKNPEIVEAIKERSKYLNNMKSAIATREERQKLWTDIMKNNDPHRKEELDGNGIPIPEGNIPLVTRLKASELLGKSEADFIDKIDVNHTVTLSDIILKSYEKDETKSLEDIEAEYYRLKEPQNIVTEAIDDKHETLDDLV